jgi:lysophospholipase L1-like esterase
MKTILCFGDSNTYGINPDDGKRFPRHKRWPGILQSHLGKEYEVIEEGLKGRTTTLDDPIEGTVKNGRLYLQPCLESHTPLDLVILLLGTCEMKNRFRLNALDIALGMERLLKMISQSTSGIGGKAPDILLLSPIPFGPEIIKNPHYAHVEHLPEEVANLYEELAKIHEIAFLETGKVVQASPKDSLHLDDEGHQKLGTAIAAIVNTILE